MPAVDVIVGAYFGDEGKGKVVGAIGHGYDAVLRVNASTNAGHCVDDGTTCHVTRQLPSVFFPERTLLVIAPGALLNLVALAEEVAARPDLPALRGRLAVASSVALVIRPYVEKGQGGLSTLLGSTHQGTGPAATARTARHALHLYDVAAAAGDAAARAAVREQLQRTCAETAPGRWGAADVDEVLAELLTAFGAVEAAVGDFCVDYTRLLRTRLLGAERLLIEGCNGLLLDLLHGAHPNVTSASTNLGALLGGANLSPFQTRRAIVVTAAYANCLGKRAFPTEVTGPAAEHFFGHCNEVDVAQHHRRRVGWLDGPGLRKALAGCAGAILHVNKLDVLTGLPEIQVCTSYVIDGAAVEVMPDDPRAVQRAVPRYRTLPGWDAPLQSVRRFADLPAAARDYLRVVQELLGLPIASVGVGPRNQDVIPLDGQVEGHLDGGRA
jgi:adenylosuccinate synthase